MSAVLDAADAPMPMPMAALSEEDRKIRKPKPTEELARGLLLRYWGVDAVSLKELDSYDDANYYVRGAEEGQQFLLKFMNAIESENRGLLDGYSALLTHFDRHMRDTVAVTAPVPISGGGGRATAGVEGEEGENEVCGDCVWVRDFPVLGTASTGRTYTVAMRLMTWVRGNTLTAYLGDVAAGSSEDGMERESLRMYGQLGGVLAKVRGCLHDSFDYPDPDPDGADKPQPGAAGVGIRSHPAFLRRSLIWDVRQFPQVEPFFRHLLPSAGAGAGASASAGATGPVDVDHIPTDDASIHAVVREVMEAYKQRIVPDDAQFPRGTVHGDCNDANVIVSREGGGDGGMQGDGEVNVTGLIDFGDVLVSYAVNELAIAVAYALLSRVGLQYRRDGPQRVLRAMVERYCAEARRLHPDRAPLTAVELRHFRLILAVRLSTSVTLGHYACVMDPGNAQYLSLHAAPGRRTLVYLWRNVSDEEFNAWMRPYV